MNANANKGSKFQAGRKGTEIAALIRGEIRAACKSDGALRGCKVSVRFSWATHSKSITIYIQDAPFSVMSEKWVRANAADPHRYQDGVSRYSVAAHDAKSACERIAAEYNRFDSDSQSDYFNDDFFCHVGIDHDLEEKHHATILCASHPACCGCGDCEKRYAA